MKAQLEHLYREWQAKTEQPQFMDEFFQYVEDYYDEDWRDPDYVAPVYDYGLNPLGLIAPKSYEAFLKKYPFLTNLSKKRS